MKTSYSQNNTYINCPKHWWWSYKQRLKSPEEGASLYFGSAVDNSVMALLEGKADYLNIFENNMVSQSNFGRVTQFFDNPNIVYSYADFDAGILEPDDIAQMYVWANALSLTKTTKAALILYSTPDTLRDEMISIYKQIVKVKKNPYKKLSDAQRTYFNRCSWISLRRKGLLLIDAFKVQFLPKVKKVIATQESAYIKDAATGHGIQGYIDMVLEIEGYDKPIIFDLKTAAKPYSQDQIDLTSQLTLYAGMKGTNYQTDLVGYVVLCKNIPKVENSVCEKCGHVKTGRHNTCDNDIGGTRCHGKWDTTSKPDPQIQVLVEQKSQQQINDMFLDVGNILFAMENEIVYKDTSKCTNWYGGKCPFYDACHNNDLTGLVKK